MHRSRNLFGVLARVRRNEGSVMRMHSMQVQVATSLGVR